MHDTDVIRLGFVGAGKRMQNYYLPVLKHMYDVNLVGFTTRSDATAAQACMATGLSRYDTVERLNENVDAIIVCVPADQTTNVVNDLIKNTTAALLIETPIVSKEIAEYSILARQHGRIMCAAENWPHRPSELLKREVVASGILGDLNVVVNDFRGYEYHAMAMMRSYAGLALPTSMIGTSFSTGPVTFVADDGCQKTLIENWDTGCIELSNGVRLIHNFNSVHSRAKTRGQRSMRAMCKFGTIASDDADGLAMWNDDAGNRHEAKFESYNEHQSSLITVEIGGVKFVQRWSNKFDEQDASIFNMLDAFIHSVRMKTYDVPYHVHDAWVDWHCVQGLRFASSLGHKVTFPTPDWLVRR